MNAKQTFASAQLGTEISDVARRALWRDLYSAQVTSLEIGMADDCPFEATLTAQSIGNITCAGIAGTINSVSRTAESMRFERRDGYSLVMNRGNSAIKGHYNGKSLSVAPGGAFLDGGDRQNFNGPSRNRWVNLQLPKSLLAASFAGLDDRQGAAIAPEHPALTLLQNYLETLGQTAVAAGSLLERHCEKTVVDLIGLSVGAAGEAGEHVGLGGVRAARLEIILREIRCNYRNPVLSAKLVGLQLGLSPRYIQDLLATTGIGFAERILELRLQDAKAGLERQAHVLRRISDIAYEAGFSDISYFNRTFRRRFGCSPGGVR